MVVRNHEGELVAETAAAGRRDTLEELYARHAGDAECLAYLLTSDPYLAEDVAQEAFIRVTGRFRHLRNPDAFGAYLRKTVVNLCRSHFRRAVRERAFLRREHAFSPQWVPPPDDPLGGDLIEAMRCLPYRQRAAVVLRFYEDLSEQQSAEALRCSPRAVNALVSRAMATLRQRLGSEER